MGKVFSDSCYASEGAYYEDGLDKIAELIVDYIETLDGKYTPTSENMYDWESEFEDEEEY